MIGAKAGKKNDLLLWAIPVKKFPKMRNGS